MAPDQTPTVWGTGALEKGWELKRKRVFSEYRGANVYALHIAVQAKSSVLPLVVGGLSPRAECFEMP